ncbi:Pycsar system effector family protein [Flavobacterium humi]|uniref:HD domain-containing protein n=1 Tax=Flavobacterium humi TaxID=2562683 RepID=A0A4Z0LCC1_9FLAO|nr:Pycsar system effector family protein [Flavobacterium humi]TGD59524.1 HD domain-containing protein [Flavobacterium humi]
MDILQKTEDFVFNLLKDNLSISYTYHNFNHTQKVVTAAKNLVLNEGIKDEEAEIILVAAWLHDTGYIKGFAKHEEQSVLIARDFLEKNNKDEAYIAKVSALIKTTEIHETPATIAEKIIKDADYSHFASPDYIAIGELLREEWKLTQDKTFTDLEWASENKKMLVLCHHYFTDFAKENWQAAKDKNIFLLQKEIQKLSKDKTLSKSDIKKKKMEKLERPERGVDTMFRVTLSNHTRLSDIADSKANILLSVNAIIISIALSTLIPKLDSPGNVHLIIPTFVLLLFSVVSIIFAIMSTRPKVTSGTFTRQDIEDKKVNLLFFGNFHKMPIDEYLWAVNELMKDRDYLYNSMIRDLYYLGLVLDRKYKLLRITYMIFMIGIICSVFAFSWAFMNSGL